MKNAIYELKSIAAYYPHQELQQQIDAWIERHIGEASILIKESHPEDKAHREYQVKSACEKLGASLAKNSNMFPKFEKTKTGYECKISALYFKNEFGK
jgi:hypothetical protein